ncbi:MAG: hypothetical protein H0X38_17705 [Planctomycetes bacterium]|nr:hypothetical protein [Planctomycetota bacterium]
MRAHHLLIPLVAALLAGCGGGGNTTMTGGGGGGLVGGGGGGGGTGGSAGSPIPIYILVGGHKPTSVNPVHAVPPGADIFLDGLNVDTNRLRPGEIYIMAKNALSANTNYTVAVTASTFGSENFTRTWSFTTGATANPPTFAGTVIGELNALRGQAGAAAVASSSNFAKAGRHHSGYQCEVDDNFNTPPGPPAHLSITHNEPLSTKRFFVDNDFANRISVAVGKPATAFADGDPAPWGTGITTVYEDVASSGGVPAMDQLWNTVYHRIPMLRAEVAAIGNGDRTDAAGDGLNTPSVISSTGTFSYQTIEFAGNGAMQTLVFWPADGQTGIPISFNTNSESPDPISAGNGNGTTDDDVVGPPLTVLFPTSQDFNAVTVTLTQN